MAERETSADHHRHGAVGPDETQSVDAQVRPIAARLFGELGYDAVSVRMVADAAGVDPDTLTTLYGGKRGLYVTVMEWSAQHWRDQLEPLLKDYTPDTHGLTRVMDEYLEHCLEHPEVPRLLIHRWMSDASDIIDVEQEIAPLIKEAIEAVRRAAGPGVDPQAATWTLVWTIHGYLQSGYLDDPGRLHPPTDPRALGRFRQHLHWLIQQMTAPG
jgi:TetR/AcrR family transcriptional regulator